MDESYEDIVTSKETLTNFLNESTIDYELINIPGNGLCIPNSFKECYEQVLGIKLSTKDILENLRQEITANIDIYSNYVN